MESCFQCAQLERVGDLKYLQNFGFTFTYNIATKVEACEDLACNINNMDDEKLSTASFLMRLDQRIREDSPIMKAVRLALRKRGLYEKTESTN
jgi:hypothetical protein